MHFIGVGGVGMAESDVVAVTPAVCTDNPEFVAAQGKIRYRGDVLAFSRMNMI